MSLRRNTRKKPLRDFAVREKVASWLLLAAFLPMLVLSSLHTHSPQSKAAVAASYQQAAQDECSECVRHLPHAGHFTTATTPLHPCVFCQFLSLTYLFVAVATIIKHNHVRPICRDVLQSSVRVAFSGIVGLRAPPPFSH